MSTAKKVFVTGGGTGIGKSIVQHLARHGYDVDFTFNSTAPAWMDEAERKSGEGALRAIRCDLTKRSDVDALTAEIRGLKEGYYGFVHNAGVAYDTLFAHVKLDRARTVLDVNFWAFVELCKAALPAMIRNRRGRIVAISSIAANRGTRGNAIYAASKAALNGFAKCLTAEVASRGITVNCVLPGMVATEMMKPYEKDFSALTARIPNKRLAEPDDVAPCVQYLLSEGARHVTGTELVVDGGISSTTFG